MSSMIGRGPITVMLVFSRTCPHCTTYMPIWKKLCATQGRKANMISMESQTYQKTPMASQKQVTGVPTVLYVDKEGAISEASDPRNMSLMTNTVKVASGSDLPASITSDSNMFNPMNMRRTSSEPILGTRVSENPLEPMPAMTQSGGNPWAAFLVAARQAAPAAALLGAYAVLPKRRSSGLPAPRKTRRRRRS